MEQWILMLNLIINRKAVLQSPHLQVTKAKKLKQGTLNRSSAAVYLNSGYVYS